ncbi:alpha/beta hydrolase [Leucobacter aridicollis]|uniref:alpha/beta hydrolase n=1 Tax=Leucobacter aridicollis TaxID=283878 RepID=UPI002107534B|nr:alpha/beta hydrolase [Leucobacter aridicollis]UTX53216.1 alpha/beta hydrolase [Leucobacter aridicollis]
MIQWRPDVLGDGFEQLTFELGADDDPAFTDGKGSHVGDGDEQQRPRLVATLVRSLPTNRSLWQRIIGRARDFEDVDVLYVHGWSDYFFQTDLARFWTERGARFFALDLRRYGRSLRPGQTAGYVDDLEDYDVEIDFALAEMRASSQRNAGERKILLLGHSTGGLVLSLWASRHPGVADAVVLNSPWLELQLSTRGRQMIAPIVTLGAKLSPLEGIPQLDYGFYARAMREVGPDADVARINQEWRPEQSHPVHTGWLKAILAGHDLVYRGLNIDVPVCVLLSARSAIPARWSPELTRADSVLDVDGVARAALRLGPSVTIERIQGALHDVFVSAEEPRHDAYTRMERFAKGWRRAVE